jgi:RNA polymerase sigma-70 factor, ECF subfamily
MSCALLPEAPVVEPRGEAPARVFSLREQREVDALRAGDEQAFRDLIRRHGPSMIRVAMAYVRDRAAAEEIVQETWIRLLRGIDGFEGRASLRTWIFTLLTNCARERLAREGRTVPMSALDLGEEPAVEPSRFFPADHPRWAGMWATSVRRWDEIPESHLLSRETFDVVRSAADRLPPTQAAVLALRDIEGCEAEEVCRLLDITDGNQRVLLHRARSRVRRDLARYLEGDTAC